MVSEQKKRLGTFPYVIGGMSFIPLIGVLFGLIAIVWGLVTKKAGGKKLAFIGGGGITFTVVLYSSLFYFGFVQRGGIYDDLRVDLSKRNLSSLVQAIEFYQAQNGHYPESLGALKKALPEDSTVFVFDLAEPQMEGEPRHYHYELKDESHYYLLGVGSDGKPYTSDDILPNIEMKEDSSIGLLIHEQSIK